MRKSFADPAAIERPEPFEEFHQGQCVGVGCFSHMVTMARGASLIKRLTFNHRTNTS